MDDGRDRYLWLGADGRRDVHLSPPGTFCLRGGTLAGSAGFLGESRTILKGSLEGSSIRFVTKRLVTAGSDQWEAVNHYAGTIEGDKIDMVLSIEDAASSVSES
jgi:hypothetical protein